LSSDPYFNLIIHDYNSYANLKRGRCDRDRMVVGFTTTYAKSVPITTNVVSSNPAGEVYLIQYYVIKFVSDLRQVGGFLPVLQVSTTNKTDRHAITKILLKVTFNTITPNQTIKWSISHFIYSWLT